MAKKIKRTPHSNYTLPIGLILIGLAFLLFLAIVTYHVDDPISFKGRISPVAVKNWLGPLGAYIASLFMQWTIGYAALVFPVILFFYGSALLRKRGFQPLTLLVLKLSAWAGWAGIILALPQALSHAGRSTEYYPSGLMGGWLAGHFVLYTGKIGAILIVLLLFAILAVISFPMDGSEFAKGLRAVRELLTSGFLSFLAALKQLFSKLKIKPSTHRAGKNIPKKEATLKVDTPASAPDDKQRTVEELPPLEVRMEEAQPTEKIIQPDVDDATFLPEDTIPDENLDFEFQEAVQEEELDYDDLVRESVARYQFPSIELLNSPLADRRTITRDELKANAVLLETKLLDYGVKARVVRVTAGPVITLYELQPATGVKINSIVNLENDLALAMEARGIRIIAPIPGKAAVGIEIPNRFPQMVYLKSLIRSEKFNKDDFELPLAIGKAINGESYIVDLVKMPHLLIAGATGSGKSVGINTIILSLLYAVDPGRVKFVMVDPKKLELSLYAELDKHYLLYRPDLDEKVITKPNNAVSILNTMVLEMERRQERMHHLSVRNIREYNKKIVANPRAYKKTEHQLMPYIVILIDELADLMMVASKEVELPIARLAQMARAGGIHMIVATQRPSVDVITGLIKANFPARLAYQVASKIDSRTILDGNGADKLLGNGDMLFKQTGTQKAARLQNPFVATEEVEAVIKHIRKQPSLPYYSLPQPAESRNSSYDDLSDGSSRDPLYEDARAIVVQHQSGSISLLQRRLKIGYSRAARLIDEMEEEGIVGAAIGGKPREVLMTAQELNQIS